MTCEQCGSSDITQDFNAMYYPAGEPEKHWACNQCKKVFYMEESK